MSHAVTEPTPSGVVTLRDATSADAEFLAWVMLTAMRSHLERGVWDYLFGWDEEKTLGYLSQLAVTGPDHMFRWSRFIVAEVDGQPAAGLCGYDPVAHGFEVYLPVAMELAAAHGTDEAGLAAIMTRGQVVSDLFVETPADCWVVEAVATAPAFRRRGLVDRLLEAVLDRGRQAGFARAGIGILIGNEPARCAYVKHGFESLGEYRSEEFERALVSPGFEFFRRPL